MGRRLKCMCRPPAPATAVVAIVTTAAAAAVVAIATTAATESCLVDLKPSSNEYRDALRHFRKSCANEMVKIERVQNAYLWQASRTYAPYFFPTKKPCFFGSRTLNFFETKTLLITNKNPLFYQQEPSFLPPKRPYFLLT